MFFFSTLWINIDLSLKYFIFIILKNFISYNEELFLFSIYIILFLIIFVNSILLIEKFLKNVSLDLLEVYEKLIYLKVYLLFLLKKNYILFKKCEYFKIYIRKLFIELFIKNLYFKYLINNDIKIINFLNYNNLLIKGYNLKKNFKR